MLEKKKKKVWFDQPAQKLLLNRHGSSHIDTNSWNPKQMHLDNYGTTVYNWTSKEAFFKVVVESVWIPYMTIWQKYNMSNLNPWLIFDCMWLWLHEKHHYYYCCGETIVQVISEFASQTIKRHCEDVIKTKLIIKSLQRGQLEKSWRWRLTSDLFHTVQQSSSLRLTCSYSYQSKDSKALTLIDIFCKESKWMGYPERLLPPPLSKSGLGFF